MDIKSMWAMYFGGLVAIQYHPRNSHNHVDLTKLGKVADDMVTETLRRFPWQDGQQLHKQQLDWLTPGCNPAQHTKQTVQTSDFKETSKNGKKT